MGWWGKIIGGAVGYMLGGPLGALLGASLAHQLSAAKGAGHQAYHSGDQERVQAAFFTATFAVMGHIAKADGRVSRDEINLVEQVMSHMRLNEAQRELAQSLFDQGKQADFQFSDILQQLRRECRGRSTLIKMFIELQIQAALADGKIDPNEHKILQQLAQSLGITNSVLEQLIGFMQGHQADSRDGGPSLEQAYQILGVQAHTPLADIRKTYRRLLSRHHPDKLVAKGLPQEMIKLANEKTHEIRTAWERVKKSHQDT